MSILGTLAGIWDFGSKLFQTGYNVYTNERDFDYQKSLQQEIFNREDTAVQRRMEDLKAAGLNPNLAAGSSAGAGAVVGRSSTNDLNVGSALDTISAINQIKLQRQENENARLQNEILKNQASSSASQSAIDFYYTAMSLGFNPRVKPVINDDGSVYYNFNWYNTGENKMTDTPLFNLFKNNFDYQINTNSYLEKQLQWYNANQVADMLTGGIGAITGLTNAGASLKRANSMIRR